MEIEVNEDVGIEEKMEVELLRHTDNPEEVVAKTMRSCRTKEPAHELDLEKEPEYYVFKAIDMGHTSVLEHVKFTFSIKNISRTCTHQLVRHRLASYSQQSLRHTGIEDMEPEDFIVPRMIKRAGARAIEDYRRRVEQCLEMYRKFIDYGIPKEDARFVIPMGVPTNITVTMNARELLHFFKLRISESAQWEIQKLAKKMLSKAKNVAPSIFREVDEDGR